MTPVHQQLSPAFPLGSELDARGRLQLGGCDAVDLAREFGTPAYVVVEDDLRARARAFVDAFRSHDVDFEVHFASKAFPCTAIYRILAEEGIGCDVASGGELAGALRGGFAPERIVLHGNAKSRAELEYALDRRVGLIVIDNLDEIALLQDVLGSREQDVLLRIAPGVSPETHPSISTGGPNTKFGLNLDDAARALDRLGADPRLRVEGLHFHIGSQILALDPFRQALARVAAALGTDFRTWNLGGGLGATYGTEAPPPVEEYVAAKVAMVRELVGPGRRIMDEPGRALTANSTVTLYTVQSVKQNVATWVAVDGGMSDNLRPMLYGARYEVEVADRFGGGTACHVTGKHCESGDVLVRDAVLDDPHPGDVLVTPATGAYGFSLANTYNGQPRPPVVLVSGGSARVVVRRETYEDLYARDVP
jgi:diaminopimelate decarboxylase